ncbi:hypothetical protein B0T26DRAFT_736787 [Lasiosphaeria miniovina]|uniref:Uncharacterized protein n=1 Tax=Lasiosphaeria miniovina TaxID=1954250 RepID=A0AA40EE09_9PEZI|nr:uncharacterized protein B0T26DRAFT_736787 [Lasiosphaeria miniovina]KAK0734001.1 hypothetical protein B0T26DRAFT_736787 [Lasiosphaeria miniovina]
MNQHSGSATLPRGFRYSAYDAPKTPEPFPQHDGALLPSPPRPRLKLKRRVVSHFAPSHQFLASVAAADVAIPSIEAPEADSQDLDMISIDAFPEQRYDGDGDLVLLRPRGRTYSPPKTPAPGFVPSLSPRRYPNWTIDSAISSVESTPEYESSRPSTSRSTQTSGSLFSRFSHASDDERCVSSGGDRKDSDLLAPGLDEFLDLSSTKGKSRKAPWTKAMSDHLWATFLLYLQDPKVTPFRMGKSCIPPHGVCLRVARESKRSWKGTKALAKAANPGEGKKSGSSTPTAESSGVFMQWPHTCAATRAHLRELCKLKAASGAKNHRFMSRSPTPFSQAAARHWNRRSTPGRAPSAFTTQDMSMSLALSTSDSMQPNGPLAQLTSSITEPADQGISPFPTTLAPGIFDGEPSFAERRRLGSPFGARSYGPSSSGSLAAALGLSTPMPRRLTHTVGPRRTLQSPVRLSRPGTQKRRNTQSSEPRKRPTIGADLWCDPNVRARAPFEVAPAPEFRSTGSNQHDDLFIPRTAAEPLLASLATVVDARLQAAAPGLAPPRLGSPFSASVSTSSFSFPNRLHRMHQAGSVDLGMLGRPFATVQQTTGPSAPQTRPSLAGRLAYIDQRLKELRNREARPRSESPL